MCVEKLPPRDQENAGLTVRPIIPRRAVAVSDFIYLSNHLEDHGSQLDFRYADSEGKHERLQMLSFSIPFVYLAKSHAPLPRSIRPQITAS